MTDIHSKRDWFLLFTTGIKIVAWTIIFHIKTHWKQFEYLGGIEYLDAFEYLGAIEYLDAFENLGAIEYLDAFE